MYKRRVNTYFTRDAVIPWQALTRETVLSVYTRAAVLTQGRGALVNICLGNRIMFM